MSNLPYEIIPINDKLRLIQLQTVDAERLFELTDSNRSYLGEFLPWVPYVKTVKDSRKHIEKTLDERAKGTVYTYGIESDGAVVGDISLRNIPDKTKREIGYWIAEEYAGRGITTLAVKVLTNFGLNTLGLDQIFIRAVPGNYGSNKVAEKAGYAFTGEVEDEEYRKLNVWVIYPS